jgi:hypothetical protein
MNTQTAGQDVADAGIRVDLNKVNAAAYARVAALSLEVDQWQVAYEAKAIELAQAQAELAELRNQTGPATGPALTAVGGNQ